MTKPTLVIGNKNYSSWSMRGWLLLRGFGIEFDEVQLKFHTAGWDANIGRWSPSGLVPVLWLDGDPVWDTLAIAESVAERWPDRQAWPGDPRARAAARSVCAEMHAGFHALRQAMPMNIRGSRISDFLVFRISSPQANTFRSRIPASMPISCTESRS